MSDDPREAIGAWFTLPDGTCFAAFGVMPGDGWNGFPVAIMTQKQWHAMKERVHDVRPFFLGAGLWSVDGYAWSAEVV